MPGVCACACAYLTSACEPGFSDASDSSDAGEDDAYAHLLLFLNMARVCVCVTSILTWKYVMQVQTQAQK